MRNKKLIIGAIVGFFFLLLVIMKMRGGQIEIQTATVGQGNILTTISASGMVESRSVKLGSAQMAGRVDWIGVAEGDEVAAGQILVKLDGYSQARREYLRIEELHANGFASDLEKERAKTAMTNAAVFAPFSGLISEKAVTIGEAVSPGVPLIGLVDTKNPWAEIQIDEVDIAAVSVGDRVRFTTDAYPDKEIFGKITWINREAQLKKVGGRVRMDEEDLVFRAKVEFDNAKELKTGMSVYAEIITGEKKNVVVVPRDAVTLREGKKVVFVVGRGKVDQVEVQIGAKDMVKVEVLSGVAEGAEVAVSNLSKLRDKAKIKLEKK
ncbi:MAG: efflux RND transporter periplasmic adaptor subunit [bacterium]